MTKRLTKEEFVQKACYVHGYKYDYSKVEYKNSITKVCIICLKHGEFWQAPHQHIGISKQGCPKCGLEKSLSAANCSKNIKANKEAKLKFFERIKKIHGDKYDYSKVEYKNNYTKVCIICPEHGEFWQTPVAHALLRQGCPKCKGSNAFRLKAEKEFIEKAKRIHGDEYDYSKVEYKNSITKVCIICSIHGEFWQNPNSHLQGHGCLKCHGSEASRLDAKEKFQAKARKIHGDKYDYSKVEYIDAYSKVCIICPEHGEFWQTAHDHLRGYGCPMCGESKGEREIAKWLDANNIRYEREKMFENLNGVGGGNLRFDFYLTDSNACIEFDGIQHGKWIPQMMSKQQFLNLQEHDRRKNEFCIKNGIKLLRISSKDMKKFEVIKIC